MTNRLFGTDGLRGKVNEYPMTPEVAMRLGLAAGQYFRNGSKRHKVVIGKDTRLSGYVYEMALTSGFCATGMDVFMVGPLPTPAISFLTKTMRADLGVVISASHNPFFDNGIKFFDRNGYKLADSVENDISRMVQTDNYDWDFPAPENVGRAKRLLDSYGRYIVYLKTSFPQHLTLDGLKIVLDCANGAAYGVGPIVLEELGAEVIQVGVEPDGLNINRDCGSLHPEVISHVVQKTGADVGLALDGDADRLIVCDEKGKVLDGDQIMALCAMDLLERDELPGRNLVATVMSNMALEVFMQENGGKLIRTPVGDRHVVEAMRREHATLGGEQSGHLIFMEHSTTGDGLLAALQILKIIQEKQKPLSELSGLLTPYPQVLINVPVKVKIPFEQKPEIQEHVDAYTRELEGKGRILLRYSGTEPKARVMVEGQDSEKVERIAGELAEIVKNNLS